METVLRDLEYFATLAALTDKDYSYPKYVCGLSPVGLWADGQERIGRDVARYDVGSIPRLSTWDHYQDSRP